MKVQWTQPAGATQCCQKTTTPLHCQHNVYCVCDSVTNMSPRAALLCANLCALYQLLRFPTNSSFLLSFVHHPDRTPHLPVKTLDVRTFPFCSVSGRCSCFGHPPQEPASRSIRNTADHNAALFKCPVRTGHSCSFPHAKQVQIFCVPKLIFSLP